MQKSTDSSKSAASAKTPAGPTQPTNTPPSPSVATFRQYLDGPAETFEMARRQAQDAARAQPGGAPDAEARRLFAY